MRQIFLVFLASLVLCMSAPSLAQQPSPQISSVSPSTARAGDQILIAGSGFGSSQGNGNVWLGSTYGVVVSWSDSQVVAAVASGSKTGVAQVLQGGVWSNAVDFTVITPNISGVSPVTAIAGTQITIAGTGFGASQGSGNVWLGSTYGVVVSWSDTQIVANVASGSKTGVAQVLQGGVWSNTVNLTVSTPNIVSVTPTTAIAGTQITITGSGFGASQGSGNVWLGSTYGVVVSWSDTQIVANVASGSKTGVAQVLQGGVWSNTANLTVSTPNIINVTPLAATAGAQITITGTGFGASQGSGNVWLGSTYGVVVSWSDTQIVANVASGSKTGVAQVLQGGVWSNTVNLTVSTPNITNVTPLAAIAGTQITITGTGFGASQGSGNVWLGSTYGVIVSWSDTQIVANVASGSKTGVAQVLQGGVWSNTVNLTVSTPNITSVTPTTAIAGTRITITGTGFGATQGSGNVWLGSTYGVVVSWSDTQVVANVASGSNTGVAQVLQGGVWSNTVNFTITAATSPTINASASPPPNASGWNNSDVTVAFKCTAGSAAITNCTVPQTISSEGANRVVSGTATDANGQTATASVTLNIDKTRPTLAVASPADGTVFSDAGVTVSGTVADALSGVSSVTCNGVAANASGGSFSCNISLNVGVNLVVVRATDLAGNVSGFNFHLTLTGTLPAPNSLQIIPSGVNMVVGETRQFTAVDEQGRPRSDASWTVSDTSLAAITTDTSPTLTALAVGQVTLTAAVGSVNAQTQVNTLSGTSLPPGTVRWSVPSTPGFSVAQIAQAVPANGLPDLYSIETDSSNNVIVHALTADGQQMWQTNVNLPGFDHAVPDGVGGLMLPSGNGSSTAPADSIIDLDPLTGAQLWTYAPGNRISRISSAPAISQDGAIFFQATTPELLTYTVSFLNGTLVVPNYSDSASIVALDPTLGTPRLRVPLPSSTGHDVQCSGTSPVATGAPLLSNGAIDSDGTVSFEVEVETLVQTYGCSDPNPDPMNNPVQEISAPFTSSLSLLQIKSDGSSTMTPIHSFAGDIFSQQLDNLGRSWPQQVIPDGQGGVLAAWTDYSVQPALAHVTRIGPSVQSDYTFPSLADIFGQMVLGDNSTAYLTDSVVVLAFDITSGQVLWTYQVPDPDNDDAQIIASSNGGGVAAKVTDFNTGQDTIINLDSTGNPSPILTTARSRATAALPSYSWRGQWFASPLSTFGASQIVLPLLEDFTSPWANPTGSPSGNGASGRPWYFILNWQNAFDFIPNNPSVGLQLKTDLTNKATSIKTAALDALKQAYKAPWPVVVVEGTPNTGDHQAVVQTTLPNGQDCGTTDPNQVPLRNSYISYECNMKEAQVALQIVINNAQDESNALSRQDLIQAIGRGIGNNAAHEIAHQFLSKCCSMDVLTSQDPKAAGTYNNGDADADPNPQITNSDPAPYTGYGKDGKPIHWEATTQQALTKCLASGFQDYGLTACAVKLQLSQNNPSARLDSSLWAKAVTRRKTNTTPAFKFAVKPFLPDLIFWRP